MTNVGVNQSWFGEVSQGNNCVLFAFLHTAATFYEDFPDHAANPFSGCDIKTPHSARVPRLIMVRMSGNPIYRPKPPFIPEVIRVS